MANYREYMKNQLTELLTEFGQIDELFMDYTYAEGENGKNSKDWDAEGIIKLARKLQPQIIINNRLGLAENNQGWDYITYEFLGKPAKLFPVHGVITVMNTVGKVYIN